MFFDGAAHGETLFSCLMLYRLGFGLGDLMGVYAAESFALGVDLMGNAVGFFEALVKDRGDNTKTEIPACVVIIEHEDGIFPGLGSVVDDIGLKFSGQSISFR